jgi:uncharacterized membrane protein
VRGTFVATFHHRLLVLRTIRHAEEDAFVPPLSVTLGVLFALASMGVLIYFIHHVSVSIQADEIVSRVGAELIEGIDRLFPEHIGQGAPAEAAEATPAGLPADFDRQARPIAVKGDGYIQFIDPDVLMRVATRDDLLLRLEHRPGHYIVAGSALALAWPAEHISEQLTSEINEAIILGNQRTPVQDFEFALSQLVEIAVRALSPGVNDPYTAIRCVDRLGSALCRLAGRSAPSPYRRDKQNRLRVIAPPIMFPAVVDAAFNQIRQNAHTCAAVLIRLIETISVIASCVHRPEDRAALLRQAEIIARSTHEGLPDVEDRRDVEKHLQTVRRIITENRELSGNKHA